MRVPSIRPCYRRPVTLALGALIVAAASFVYGLAGFGIGLVALAFLPFVMPPADAIVLTTIYAAVFALVVVIPLRRDLHPRVLALLILGSLLGTAPGVWALASLPAPILNRLIGAILVGAVGLELRGLYPTRLHGPGWALGAGLLGGLLGGAVGTPGPPVILYSAAQGWSPRAVKANLQAFFAVNQAAILAGSWWAGLLTAEVRGLTVLYAAPALAGVLAGMACFDRIDQRRFRQIVFGLLFLSGVVLLVRG